MKVWECASFKEFIEGKFSGDEIYFYLMVRDWVGKGRVGKGGGEWGVRVMVGMGEVGGLIEMFMSSL